MSETQSAEPPVDHFAYSRDRLGSLPVEERSAIYLNSIRKLLMGFMVLAVIGLIVAVILGIADINAINQGAAG